LYFCIVNDINETMAEEQFKLENQLCFRLYTAARLTMGAYHPYLEPLGITYPQYLVLLVLWEKDKRPVCEIGKRLFLETNTITPLLQRMEKAGLVTRTRGKEDAPAYRLPYRKRARHAKASGRHPREYAKGGGAEIERGERNGSHA